MPTDAPPLLADLAPTRRKPRTCDPTPHPRGTLDPIVSIAAWLEGRHPYQIEALRERERIMAKLVIPRTKIPGHEPVMVDVLSFVPGVVLTGALALAHPPTGDSDEVDDWPVPPDTGGEAKGKVLK